MIWGVHAPKAKRWSIAGSNHITMLIRLNKIPQILFMAALSHHFSPFWTQTITLTLA